MALCPGGPDGYLRRGAARSPAQWTSSDPRRQHHRCRADRCRGPARPSSAVVEIYFSVVQRKALASNDFHAVNEIESHLLDSTALRTNRHAVGMEIHQGSSERPT